MFIFGKKKIFVVFAMFTSLTSFMTLADGGISIKGTRVIYPQNSKQENVYVGNSSSTDSFLVQSWVENKDGSKVKDFIVTPPLYLSGPKNENVLRLIKIRENLPTDRETLYFLIVKAIPSVDNKNKSGGGVLRVAAATKIKLISRPNKLNGLASGAPSQLTFRRLEGFLEINNPTPYFITITDMLSGKKSLGSTMIEPRSQKKIKLKVAISNSIEFQAIDDSGAVTKVINKSLE